MSFKLSGYLKKYHEEHTKVSKVSASLYAFLPHFGHVVLIKLSHFLSGLSPSGVNSTSSGKTTGKSFSGTGTIPQSSQ